jgi:hypothetical protein
VKLGKIALEKRKMAMRIRAVVTAKLAEDRLDLLNELLPAAEIAFDKKVQQGQLPVPIDLKKTLGA